MVHLAARVTSDVEPRSSLEYDRLKASLDGRKDLSVRDLVRAPFRHDWADPWVQTLDFVHANLIRADLATAEKRQQAGLLGKVAGSQLVITWDQARLAPLLGEATAAWDAFAAWRLAEPLAEVIRTQVADVLTSRRTVEADDD